MRIPKPRLRQVFEHTTSFKVKKPTGQTITIAKKGLSPSTIGRLRRFAQGGEVQDYQVGGQVSPADEAGIQFELGERERMKQPEVAPEALAQAAAPQPVEPAEIPRTGRRVVKASEATADDSETQARQTLAYTKYLASRPDAPASMTPVASTAPATAPVTVIVQPPQQPAAPQPAAMTPVRPAAAAATQKPEAAPGRVEGAAPEPQPGALASAGDIEAATEPQLTARMRESLERFKAGSRQGPVAPIAGDVGDTEAAATEPQLTDRMIKSLEKFRAGSREVIRPGDLPASAMGEPRPYVPQPTVPVGRYLSQSGLLVPSLAAPAEAPTDMAAPAAVPAPVAPVPTPVAPAAVAPPRSIKAQALRDEAKKDPSATVADLVTRIAGVDAAIDPIVMQGAAAIPAVDMLRTGKIADAYVAGVAQELDAAKLEADARVEQARIEQEALNAERLRAAEKAKADIERAEALRTHSKQLEQEAMASDNLKSFFDSQGTAYSVLSLVSLAIGGFLSGYTNTPNYVLRAFNDAMDKDLEEQKRRRTSKWNRYKEVLGDADAADLLVRADNDQLASIAIKKASLQQNVAKIRPELERLQAQLQQKAALNMAALDLKLAQAEDEREKATPRVVMGGGGKDSDVSKERLKLAKEAAERERLLNVDGIPVRRSTRQRQAMTQSGVDRRIAYIENVARLEKAIKDHGANVWNVLATQRGDIISELALSLENSPQGFGYERALSRNAAVVLKQGMGDPTSVKAAVLKAFGRDPAAGIRALRQDTQRQLKQLLAGVADPSNQRDKDAAEYGQWKVNNRIKRVLGEKEDPAPKLSTPTEQIVLLPPDSPLYRPPAVPAAAATPGAPATDWRSRIKPVGKL